MEAKIKDLEDSIHLITEKLNQIEKRISNLEQKNTPVTVNEPNALSNEIGEEFSLFPKILPGVSRATILPVIGRTFLVFAGAFLLRVFTENETFIPILGAAIGLIYSIIWLYFAYRAAGKDEQVSASFHGVSSVLIAFPLIIEASTKLDIFSPVQTILVLFVLTGFAIFVATRRNLRSLYVFYILAALFTAVTLMISSGKVGLFNVFILIIGLITISIKYFKEWHILPWIAAFFGNIAVAFLVSLASSPEKLTGRYGDVSVTFALIFIIIYMIIYLSGFITATLYLKRQISIFGIFQSLFVLIIGLIGTISISHGTGIGYSILGLFTLVFAIGFYLIAFIIIKTKEKLNFYYYSWMAFILSVASIWILCDENLRIISLGILSLGSIFMTKFIERFTTLSIQSVLYLFLTAWFSNLIRLSISSLISTKYEIVQFSFVIVFGLAISIVIYAFHILFGNFNEQKIQIPRFLVLLITVLGIFGVVISLISNVFAFSEDILQLHKLALIRTITLALSAIILAWLSNKPKFFELAYLVYPILIVGGLKLLFEDLGNGTPITLFIGFAFYGIALITAPKIKYKVKKDSDD